MGSLKTLGLAGLAVVLTALGTGFGQAADMAPPPPPMMPPPAPMIDAGGGFYLRGDIGASNYNYDRLEFSPQLPTTRTLTHSLSNAYFLGVGAGYQFNSWIRADVTGEYRMRAKFRIFEETAGAPPGYNLLRGNLTAGLLLANAYIDLGTWHRITPFVGLGAGLAMLSTSGVTDTGYGAFAGGSGRAADKTKTSFAWALHAGLGYDLTANLKAEVGYRYTRLGTVNTANVACTVPCAPFNGRIKTLDSHDLKFGIRYLFADAPAQMMYPGPLVRKY